MYLWPIWEVHLDAMDMIHVIYHQDQFFDVNSTSVGLAIRLTIFGNFLKYVCFYNHFSIWVQPWQQ